MAPEKIRNLRLYHRQGPMIAWSEDVKMGKECQKRESLRTAKQIVRPQKMMTKISSVQQNDATIQLYTGRNKVFSSFLLGSKGTRKSFPARNSESAAHPSYPVTSSVTVTAGPRRLENRDFGNRAVSLLGVSAESV